MSSNGPAAVLSENDDLKQKCKDLKQKILKVEDFNKLATLNINRTKTSINRLRLEYSILLERLETRAAIPEVSDVSDFSDFEISDKKAPKKKKGASGKESSQRDPGLPKRPLNPYLIFCDIEKDKYRKSAEADGKQIDLSKTLGEAWKKMGEEGRQPYVDFYNQDKERYNREMETYENSNSVKRLKTNNGKATKPSSGGGDKPTESAAQVKDEQEEELVHKETRHESKDENNDIDSTQPLQTNDKDTTEEAKSSVADSSVAE